MRQFLHSLFAALAKIALGLTITSASTSPAAVADMQTAGRPIGFTLQEGSDFYPNPVYEWAAAGSRCSLSPALLAAVGKAASNNGVIDGYTYDAAGTIKPDLFGERADGSRANLARIADTDFGVVDQDPFWDRPVGPFQLLPVSWLRYGFDANKDGAADPQNLWDSAASAANFLCAMGAGTNGDDRGAVRRYTGSDTLTARVLSEYVRGGGEGKDLLSSAVDRTPPSAGADDIVVVSRVDFDELGIDGLEPERSMRSLSSLASSSRAQTERAARAGRVVETPTGVAVEQFRVPQGQTSDRLAFARSGDVVFEGDWNGDGSLAPAVWRTMPKTELFTDPSAMFITADANGNYYGARTSVINSASVTVLTGDWDGDGRDSLAIRRPLTDELDEVKFYDQYGPADMAPLELDHEAILLVVAPALRSAVGIDDDDVMEIEPMVNAMIDESEEGLDLVLVGGIRVASSVADQVEAMLQLAADDGVELTGWGWRSHERQIELRKAHCADVWETPASQCNPPTATPGHSRHEFGLAIDFHVDGSAISSGSPEFGWLSENAHRFGFFNLPSEPWHWSVDGR